MTTRQLRWVRMRAPAALGLVAASLLAAWSCSGDDEAPPEAAAVCGSALPLQVGPLTARPEPGWYEAKATQGGKEFTLRVELNSQAGAPLEKGTYKLGSGDEGSYTTCQRCVLLLEGSSEPEQASRVFFAAAGSVTLDTVPGAGTSASRGSLSGVALREVTLDPATSATKTKRGGSCYSVKQASWDHEPEAGAECQRASDCGDTSVAACDATGHCVVRQCDFDGKSPCAEGSVCIAQTLGASSGVCYQQCSPARACPSGLECAPLDASSPDGRCVPPGPAAEGEDCDESLASTGCQAGLRCVRDGDGGEDGAVGNPVCRRSCDFFGAASCGGGQRCAFGGYCTPLEYDPAAIDAPCQPDGKEGLPCGADAKAYRGLCVAAPELKGKVVCRRACTTDGPSVCPSSQFCGPTEGDLVVATVCRPSIAEGVQP